MSKTYRPYEPDQMLLLPPSLQDWLPPRHLARFVSDVVEDLDLSAITSVYEREERGYPPYHPVMMVKVLFLQVLKLCRKAGLVKLGHIALDGTKVKANASKHKAMSYGRMKAEEARLQAEIKELLHQAEAVDEQEDAEYGRDK